MMYYTHLAFGFLISLIALNFMSIRSKVLFVLMALLFSIFPDIDETKSKIGRKSKLISKTINLIFGHRSIFHTIYIPIILFLFFYNINNEIALAILIGYFSHLFLDSLTKAGIKPLYPLLNKKIKGFFKTNSIYEKIFFLVIIFVDLYAIITYI